MLPWNKWTEFVEINIARITYNLQILFNIKQYSNLLWATTREREVCFRNFNAGLRHLIISQRNRLIGMINLKRIKQIEGVCLKCSIPEAYSGLYDVILGYLNLLKLEEHVQKVKVTLVVKKLLQQHGGFRYIYSDLKIESGTKWRKVWNAKIQNTRNNEGNKKTVRFRAKLHASLDCVLFIYYRLLHFIFIRTSLRVRWSSPKEKQNSHRV